MHNYMKKLRQMRETGEIPSGLNNVAVHHDQWCGIYRERRCNCNPAIDVLPAKDGENFLETYKLLENTR